MNRQICSIFLRQTSRVLGGQLIYPAAEALEPVSTGKPRPPLLLPPDCGHRDAQASSNQLLPRPFSQVLECFHFVKYISSMYLNFSSCHLQLNEEDAHFAALLCPLRDVGLYPPAAPSPPASLTRPFSPSLPCIPTLPTVGSSTSLFLFLHAVCLTAPWADSFQEVHLGHGEI